MNLQDVIKESLKNINTEKEQEDFILENDPETSLWLAYLHHNKYSSQFINKLSEIVLNSGNENLINFFYCKIEFDKSKYESYFRNLIFK